MKRLFLALAIMGVVGNPAIAEEVVIKDPIVREAVAKNLKKPYGKFVPPPKFTKAELAKVTYLQLGNTKITDTGLKELAKLQQLKRLYLYSTKITDTGLKDVAKLKHLISLSLIDTQITNTGLKEVAKLQNLTGLGLYECTKITDAGLVEVAKLQNLTLLFLPDTITPEGVAELKKALPKCRILSNPKK